MKFDIGTISQNIIAGCIGASFVMAMANAQRLEPSVSPEINCRRFNLVGADGRVCGSWSADDKETAFRMSKDTAKISLSANANDAIITATFSNSPADRNPAHSSAMMAEKHCSAFAALDHSTNAAANLLAADDVSSVDLRGRYADVVVRNGHGKEQVVIGSKNITEAGGQEKISPLGSVTLLDDAGHIRWKHWLPD